MIQPVTRTFYQDRASYIRTRRLGWLMCTAYLLCTLASLLMSFKLWGTYTHVFTFYLKWQDALVALLWLVAFLTLCGSVLTLRFLNVVHTGYRKGVFSFLDTPQLAVRDLSSENLASIFWMLGASFGCFLVVLIGLVPVILIGWTLHLAPPFLAVVGTALAILLSLVGIVLSIMFASFIAISLFGAVAFWQKLGAVNIYSINTQTTIRCDDNLLTVIYPNMPESMIDLNTLDKRDRLLLLALLRERWLASGRLWNLEFGDEKTADAQEEGTLSNVVLVS